MNYLKFIFSVFLLDFLYVIGLLSGKTAENRQLFSELNYYATRLKVKFEPKHVMSSFEMSLTKVVEEKVCLLSSDLLFVFSSYQV